MSTQKRFPSFVEQRRTGADARRNIDTRPFHLEPESSPGFAARLVLTRIVLDPAPSSGAVSGAMAATEGGADAFAASGAVLVSGTLAVSEIGAENASVSGQVLVQGALGTTETGGDTLAASGAVTSPLVVGTVAATEAGEDTFAASGNVVALAGERRTEGGHGRSIDSPDFVAWRLGPLERLKSRASASRKRPTRRRAVELVEDIEESAREFDIARLEETIASLKGALAVAERLEDIRRIVITAEFALAVAIADERKQFEIRRQMDEDDAIAVLLLAA